MDKIKYVKLENEDGSYSDSIPLAVDAEQVSVGNDTLINELNKKATKEEVAAVASGSPAGAYETVVALTTADPDHSKIYLVTADGHWYYYNNGWQDGGVYQATEIENNSVTEEKLEQYVKDTIDRKAYIFDMLNNSSDIQTVNLSLSDLEPNNKYLNDNGNLISGEANRNMVTKMLPVHDDISLIVDIDTENISLTRYKIAFYDKNKNPIICLSKTSKEAIVCPISWGIPAGTYYFRLAITIASGTYFNYAEDIYRFSIAYKPKFKRILTSHKNLIDPNASVAGYIEKATGELNYLNNWRTSELLSVDEGILYANHCGSYWILKNDYTYSVTAIPSDSRDDVYITIAEPCRIAISYPKIYADSEMCCYVDNIEEIPAFEDFCVKSSSPFYIDIDSLSIDEKIDEKISNMNILYHKKYYACGDSFTQGDFSNSISQDYYFNHGELYEGQKKVYPFWIGNRNLMNVTNLAVNGSTLAHIEGRTISCFSTENGLYTQIPADVDYITIKYGINDGHQHVPIGTIDDNINTTFYGAWNIVLDYLIRKCTKAKIGIIVSNGLDSNNYAEATINIAKKFGLAYLNEYSDESVPALIRLNRPSLSTDIQNFREDLWTVNPSSNRHPNEKCHEYESTIVEDFLRKI